MKIYNMKIYNIIIISLTILVIVPASYILLSVSTGSMKIFIVLSESMVPIMLIGDSILVKNISEENIKVGDIIAFYQNDKVVSHRVIGVYKGGNNENNIIFQTKGDNVKDKDPFVVGSNKVIGKAVFKVPYIGYLTKFSKRPILFLIFTIIPSVLIIVDELRKMTKSSIQIRRMERNEKKRKKKEERAIDKISYVMLMIIIFIGIIVPFILNFSYIDPEFWANFSDSPCLMSGVSYIVILAIILLMTSSLWSKNRYSKNSIKDFKKEMTRELYNIRKMVN